MGLEEAAALAVVGKDWVVEERAAATATAVEVGVEGLGVEGLAEVPCIPALRRSRRTPDRRSRFASLESRSQ